MWPAPTGDKLVSQQTELIAELREDLQELAEITSLREISDGGALKLDAAHAGADARDALDASDKERIIDRAAFLLSSFYVHLPTKRALYASDPLQALRVLKTAVATSQEEVSPEADFHDRMSAIFVGLRDRHTNYYLPAPYRHTIAFLPFLVEAAVDPDTGDRRYLVTKIAGEQAKDAFGVDTTEPVEVTHINGVPIEQVVARHGADSAGANPGARHARGVDRLTFRWLGLGTGPREDWVDVSFTVGGRADERRFEWLAARQTASGSQRPPSRASDRTRRESGSGR